MEDYCGVCNGELWPQIIECICCERLFHWDCVGVDQAIEEEEDWWLCEECSSWIYGSQETNSDTSSDECESTSSNESRNTNSTESSDSSKNDCDECESTSSNESRNTNSTESSDSSKNDSSSEAESGSSETSGTEKQASTQDSTTLAAEVVNVQRVIKAIRKAGKQKRKPAGKGKKSSAKKSTKSNVRSSQRVNYSGVTTCEICYAEPKMDQWFVSGDACDRDYHIDCVGECELYEKGEWLCHKCTENTETHENGSGFETSVINVSDSSKQNDMSTNNIHLAMQSTTVADNERHLQEIQRLHANPLVILTRRSNVPPQQKPPEKITVPVSVHREGEASLEDLNEHTESISVKSSKHVAEPTTTTQQSIVNQLVIKPANFNNATGYNPAENRQISARNCVNKIGKNQQSTQQTATVESNNQRSPKIVDESSAVKFHHLASNVLASKSIVVNNETLAPNAQEVSSTNQTFTEYDTGQANIRNQSTSQQILHQSQKYAVQSGRQTQFIERHPASSKVAPAKIQFHKQSSKFLSNRICEDRQQEHLRGLSTNQSSCKESRTKVEPLREPLCEVYVTKQHLFHDVHRASDSGKMQQNTEFNSSKSVNEKIRLFTPKIVDVNWFISMNEIKLRRIWLRKRGKLRRKSRTRIKFFMPKYVNQYSKRSREFCLNLTLPRHSSSDVISKSDSNLKYGSSVETLNQCHRFNRTSKLSEVETDHEVEMNHTKTKLLKRIQGQSVYDLSCTTNHRNNKIIQIFAKFESSFNQIKSNAKSYIHGHLVYEKPFVPDINQKFEKSRREKYVWLGASQRIESMLQHKLQLKLPSTSEDHRFTRPPDNELKISVFETDRTSSNCRSRSINDFSSAPALDRDDYLHDMVKEHFTIENFGVTISSMSLHSKENELAMELLKKCTIRKGHRFETKLLWKYELCELPDSYPMAMKRLKCLENKGPNVITTINDFINDYMEKGYVSKLSQNEIARKHSRTWYLPLFTVIHPKKPEKLRPVFDGAARVNGTSLNSSLYTGPDLLASIVDVLRRFREHKIAFSGDIKEMFHQVTINEEDRNSQRFIWRNGDQARVPDVYVMNVMTFGATCSPSAAQFVKNINAAEYEKQFPRAVEAIIKNHYVDDLMDGAKNVEEGVQLINEVKFIHSQAGFEIRNFKSNSVELLKAIGEKINVDENVSVENESMIERVLGMFWNTRSDYFTFLLKFTKVTTELFWKRFTKEYLPTITRRTKWFKPVKPLERGDLVLVVDPDNPRNTYPKARILETQIGSNNQVRRAKVEFILEAKTDAEGKICKIRRKALWRPAHKSAIIDVTPKVYTKVPEAIVQVQPSVNQVPAHKNGLAHPIVDRKTGGSVGASGSKNSKFVGAAKNRTNASQSSRVLRSTVRK